MAILIALYIKTKQKNTLYLYIYQCAMVISAGAELSMYNS